MRTAITSLSVIALLALCLLGMRPAQAIGSVTFLSVTTTQVTNTATDSTTKVDIAGPVSGKAVALAVRAECGKAIAIVNMTIVIKVKGSDKAPLTITLTEDPKDLITTGAGPNTLTTHLYKGTWDASALQGTTCVLSASAVYAQSGKQVKTPSVAPDVMVEVQ